MANTVTITMVLETGRTCTLTHEFDDPELAKRYFARQVTGGHCDVLPDLPDGSWTLDDDGWTPPPPPGLGE
jgi:hypothetical protein